MNILITGGSGFIGTNLVEHFLQRGHAVLNLDAREPRNKAHLAFWKRADLLDKASLSAAMAGFGPTHVVHLAARTDLTGVDVAAYAVNNLGTRNLVETLAAQSTVKRVLFTSTMLVCRPGHIPVSEWDYSYTTFYGESKKLMEEELREMGHRYQWCIIRPTSIWGPWFETPYKDFFDRVIARKMYNIRKRSATKTYGFVLNSVYQIEKLLFSDQGQGKVFYIGDEPPIPIDTWADEIAAAIGAPAIPSLPYSVFRLVALAGDLAGRLGIPFPMTSFRLRNMTTDNILPLAGLFEITGPCPYQRREGIDITMKWLGQQPDQHK